MVIRRKRMKVEYSELVHSPVSRRAGCRSLIAGRGPKSYSKVATSSVRIDTTSTAEINRNDVNNTVHTDVRPMSVIFRLTLVSKTLFRTRTQSSHRGHRASCRGHIFLIREYGIVLHAIYSNHLWPDASEIPYKTTKRRVQNANVDVVRRRCSM